MNQETLNFRMSALREVNHFDPGVLDALAKFVTDSRDEALFRVNPIQYADDHKLQSRTAIDLFVHATRAGVFDFAWGLICPGCSAFLSARGGLKATAYERACQVCDIRAGSALDDGIEVAFTVNPAVRRIRFHGGWSEYLASPSKDVADDVFRLYFSHSIDGYGRRLLVEAFQSGLKEVFTVPREGGRVVRFDFDTSAPGDWQLVSPELHAVVSFEPDPSGPSTAEVTLDEGRARPNLIRLKPGPVELKLSHRTPEPEALVTLTHVVYPPGGPPGLRAPPDPTGEKAAYLTGKRLLSNQSFRELFRAETLPPDGSLEIRALAMLFTDLKASTQMYERVGDLKALALVREHFQLLRDVIDRNEGAVVKTIGDAVMATFTDPAKAATAAVEMHRALEKVPELQLKVGLHVGPCVAIDSNERIDYFGQTVNIAARVQGLAEGREVVITDTVLRSPGVAKILEGAKLAVNTEQAHLKGIDQPVTVHRTIVQ